MGGGLGAGGSLNPPKFIHQYLWNIDLVAGPVVACGKTDNKPCPHGAYILWYKEIQYVL